MPVTAHVQLTPEDQMAAIRLGLMSNKRRLIIVGWVLFSAFGAVVFNIVEIFRGEPNYAFLVPAGIAILVLLWAVFYQTPRQIRKSFEQQKALHEPVEVEFGETHFSTTATHGNFSMPWGDFHKWRKGRNLLIVYQSEVVGHIVPRRAFASDDEFRLAIRILETKAGRPS